MNPDYATLWLPIQVQPAEEHQNNNPITRMGLLFWWSHRELVTFRDPENSRLQTQFASECFLATRRLAGLTRIGQSGFNSP